MTKNKFYEPKIDVLNNKLAKMSVLWTSAHVLWKLKCPIEENRRKNELIEQSQDDLPE